MHHPNVPRKRSELTGSAQQSSENFSSGNSDVLPRVPHQFPPLRYCIDQYLTGRVQACTHHCEADEAHLLRRRQPLCWVGDFSHAPLPQELVDGGALLGILLTLLHLPLQHVVIVHAEQQVHDGHADCPDIVSDAAWSLLQDGFRGDVATRTPAQPAIAKCSGWDRDLVRTPLNTYHPPSDHRRMLRELHGHCAVRWC